MSKELLCEAVRENGGFMKPTEINIIEVLDRSAMIVNRKQAKAMIDLADFSIVFSIT